MFLILTALAMTVLAGCGGSGGSPQTSEKPSGKPSAERQASRTADPAEQKPKSTGPPKQEKEDTLGHPYLGSADAPVVLIEHSDYQ